MDTAVVRQFLDFFQDFCNLCQLENWPDDNTTEQEIKNAFLIAMHIDKSLDRLQKKELLNDYLSALNSHQNSTSFVKNCLSDPPKYILKKIVHSNSKITQMDVGFKVFLQLFNEEKLENYLTDFMVEAASVKILLKNLSKEICKEELLRFKSFLLLSQLNTSQESKDALLDLLQNCNRDTIELLIVSALNNDIKYYKAVKNILNAFTQVMSSRNPSDKQFWKYMVKDNYFNEFCLKHAELFKLISNALLDSGKLLREQMSAEYFYIDLTYSELVFIVQKICENEILKLEFFDIIRERQTDLEFWENMIL